MRNRTSSLDAVLPRSRAAIAFLAFGAGVACACVILGVPKLWSAEAAGWASAIATLAAVMAAIYVGLAPHRATRRDHVRRAQAVSLIVYSRLCQQHLQLEAARRVFVTVGSNNVLFGIACQALTPNPRFADDLIPFFDALDDYVASGLAAAVADLEQTSPLLVVKDGGDMSFLQAERFAKLLDPVVRSIARARERIAPFAIRKAAEDLEPAISNMVSGFRQLADYHELQAGIQEDLQYS